MLFWHRIGFLLALTLLAYLPILVDFSRNAVEGSRNAFLVVVPVLAVMICHRYRSAPRGVGDAETDWIAALLIGGAGFTAIWLVTSRLPTTATMWKLHLVALVFWIGCSTSVMFGVRYASRMVALWLFLLVSATPLPYLLMTAYFGGSDTAAALLAGAAGAVAVYLSGRATNLRWRFGVSFACLVVASATAVALRGTTLVVTVIVVAGVIPILGVIALFQFSRTESRMNDPRVTVHYTRRSWKSFAALGAIALTLLLINASREDFIKPIFFKADWIAKAGLTESMAFPFITRFLGPRATLTRYPVASETGLPTAAVDVISTPNTGALRDYADAIWYVSDAPVIFAKIELRSAEHVKVGNGVRVKVRVMHSNADLTTSGADRDWYALTWLWRGPAVTQQVTVIVNEIKADPRLPPDPRPMSVTNQVVEPLAWIPRQQWDSVGVVDTSVVRRAENIAVGLLAAGEDT